MTWKNDGAVERGAISAPRKNLAEGAGAWDALRRNGFFPRFPHLDTLAIFAVATLFIAAILWMMAARTAHHFSFSCRSGDVTTTNGRPICSDHERVAR